MRRFKSFSPIVFSLIAAMTGIVLVGCSPTNPESYSELGAITKESRENSSSISETPVTLTPASENWRENNHIHGLAVNPDHPAIIYVATHKGLLQRNPEGEWFWMGKERADYMGFTIDPDDNQRFYASGHPSTGGNLGFQMSENHGQDWQQIAMPGVDFHTLTKASADHPHGKGAFYGWAVSGKNGLYTSKDGGKTWTQPRAVGLKDAPFELVGYPRQPNRVYATTRGGLYESRDGGNNWTLVPNTRDTPIIALTLLEESANSVVMYGYRLLKSAPGIYRSADGGKTWQALGTGARGTIVKLAIPGSKPSIIYAANEENVIFQSQDGGKTWKELN